MNINWKCVDCRNEHVFSESKYFGKIIRCPVCKNYGRVRSPQDSSERHLLFIDTETTGTDKLRDRMVSISWVITQSDGKIVCSENYIVKPQGFTIPEGAVRIHNISTQKALREGKSAQHVLQVLRAECSSLSVFKVIGHNVEFDLSIIENECLISGIENPIKAKPIVCTMKSTTSLVKIPKKRGGYKWPTLTELYLFLFNETFRDSHTALADVMATKKCYFHLVEQKIFPSSSEKDSVRCKQHVEDHGAGGRMSIFDGLFGGLFAGKKKISGLEILTALHQKMPNSWMCVDSNPPGTSPLLTAVVRLDRINGVAVCFVNTDMSWLSNITVRGISVKPWVEQKRCDPPLIISHGSNIWEQHQFTALRLLLSKADDTATYIAFPWWPDHFDKINEINKWIIWSIVNEQRGDDSHYWGYGEFRSQEEFDHVIDEITPD